MKGTAQLDKRTGVWFFRYREDGVRHALRVGRLSEFPTKESAEEAALYLLHPGPEQLTFCEAAEKYLKDRAPERRTTLRGYRSKLKNHAIPRWGTTLLDDIRPLELDKWFKELPLSPTSKVRLRSVMRQVFEYARLGEHCRVQYNPLDLIRVRGGSRRSRRPRILAPEEFRRLLGFVGEPFRTMLILSVCLGVRRSELAGLRWDDVDWMGSAILIRRSFVEGVEDELKTEASEKAMPLDSSLLQMLERWRSQNETVCTPNAYIWANPKTDNPCDLGEVLKQVIQPAAKAAGLGHIGWHTCRHSYRAMLDKAGTTVGVQRELMRHSDIATTMNVYGDAFSEDQRAANSAVARMVV